MDYSKTTNQMISYDNRGLIQTSEYEKKIADELEKKYFELSETNQQFVKEMAGQVSVSFSDTYEIISKDIETCINKFRGIYSEIDALARSTYKINEVACNMAAAVNINMKDGEVK